jgi:hypothetical protein
MNPVFYVWHLMRNVRCTAWDIALLTGREKYSGEPLKILYCGQLEPEPASLRKLYRPGELDQKIANVKLYKKLLFSGCEEAYLARHIGLLGLKSEIDKRADEADMIIVDAELLISRVFPEEDYLSVPQWVYQKLTLAPDLEQTHKQFRKNTLKELRKIRNRDFGYSTSSELDDIRSFYEDMYIPFTRTRFEDAAAIQPWEKFVRWWKRGAFLLTLTFEKTDVLALYMLPAKGRLVSVCDGMSPDITPDLRRGAVTAADMFSIEYAHEQGYEEIDFISSRPFMDDGAFRYKRKWGTRVTRDNYPINDIKIRVTRTTVATTSALANNPVIVSRNDALFGQVVLADDSIGAQEIRNAVNLYWTPGMTTLKLFAVNPVTPDGWTELENCNKNGESITLEEIRGNLGQIARL